MQRITPGVRPDATQRFGGGYPEATQRIGTGHPDATQPVYGRGADATQPVYAGNQWSVPGTGQPWTAPAPAGGPGKGKGVGQLVGTVKGWPRKVQLAVAGGVAVLLLVGVIALSGGGDDGPPPIVTSLPTETAQAAPPVDMQEQSVKGVTLQVPKGWDKNAGGVFVDFVDPKQDGRKVRVLAEKWDGTSKSWAEFASRNLGTKAKSCAKPYEQLAMTDTTLAGKPAAEFEYTCGDGDSKRHGVWRGVAQDGKIYSFYLTANDGDFAASKPIFDAMASSFKFGGGS
ncbi:PsbP-related protein [Micromonospora sp. NPDC003776]